MDSIIKDLAEVAVKMTREEEIAKVRDRAADAAEERMLDALLPHPKMMGFSTDQPSRARAIRRRGRNSARCCAKARSTTARSRSNCAPFPPAWRSWRRPAWKKCRSSSRACSPTWAGSRTKPRKLKVKEAQKLLVDEEAGKLVNEEELRARALANAEQNGIVFIDEIDKIARRQETMGADVSREGVQRDLLPLVEGSTVSTKYGQIKTDHILFIASGAFHMSKPSDLIPELQGRFPIRVELDSLGVDDFVRILTEPDASLTAQYRALHGHRERRREVRRRRRAPHRRDRLQRQREDREHRRAPAAHRHGAAARDRVVRRRGEWRHRPSRSMRRTSTSTSARSPRTRTCRRYIL